MDRGKTDRIHELWDELADFEASETDVAANHLMTSLCRLVNAQNAVWMGAVCLNARDSTDPLKGWRVPVMRRLRPIAASPDKDKLETVRLKWEKREIDPSFLIPIKGLGRFRYHSHRRALPAQWFQSPHYKNHYASIGIHDTAYIGFPLNRSAESHFGFHRMNSRKAFTAEEMELMAYALRGIKWFHRRLMLFHGLLAASAPATPSERKVLRLLLTPAPEKEIARQAGLTPASTHQYIKRIFRKFGVNSRAGLMCLWISRGC